jgi:hypothetical protein
MSARALRRFQPDRIAAPMMPARITAGMIKVLFMASPGLFP